MARRPNILLITSDQQHWSLLGCQNPEVQTPNLDRLAKMGTLYERAYCPNPTCTPTRASIITGMYPSQHGAWSLGTKLLENVHTVGEDFAAAGYRTALVGKAHFQQLQERQGYTSLESYPILQDLDFWRGFHGPFYGFDHVELARNHADEAHCGQHYAIWMEEKGLPNWRDYYVAPTGTRPKHQEGRWEIPEEFHYNTWIAERSNALMREYAEADEPFFLWSSFFDPHPPYLVPEPWDTMYDPATLTLPALVPGEHDHNPPHFQLTQVDQPDFSPWSEDGQAMHGFHSHLRDSRRQAQITAWYYGMMTCLDKYVGKILDELDALGLTDNTVVVYTSDHGHLIGQHGMYHKGPFMYEDLVRVPFIVRAPGQTTTGDRSHAIQSLVDLAPTFLDFCDLPIPRSMTGKSQKAVWLDPTTATAARDHALSEHHHQPTTIYAKTYVNAQYKLTTYLNRPYGELFDLKADPHEVHNLWDDPASQLLKLDLMQKLVSADLAREPMPMPRVTHA